MLKTECQDFRWVAQRSKNTEVSEQTGKTANEYIHLKLIDVAKEKIFDANKSVSEIAYELGFKYPQHFTRVFKQHTGVTPLKYRRSMN